MYEYTQGIREFFYDDRRRYPLLKRSGPWLQLRSCLDAIEDADLAIDAYLAGGFGESREAYYLPVYGLLQALFVQQDATFNLCESLAIPETIHNYPRLEDIREMRNDSIGHPTKRNRKKGQPISYNLISRITLSLDGFELISHYSDGKLVSKYVSIPDLIADQRKYISDVLTMVMRKLEEEEAAHKEKFKMEKLVSIFPSNLDYLFSNLISGTINSQYEQILYGKECLQQIKQTLAAFQKALARRGIELETYDSINYVHGLLEYPLDELEKFFRSFFDGGQPNINEKTAFIFAFFVEKQVNELKDMARVIDDDYSS